MKDTERLQGDAFQDVPANDQGVDAVREVAPGEDASLADAYKDYPGFGKFSRELAAIALALAASKQHPMREKKLRHA